jgi:PEP-CTERM motif
MNLKLGLISLFVAVVPASYGATIISFPSPQGAAAIYALQADWASWKQTVSYGNVAIAAQLQSSQGGNGTAYLTNAIGPTAAAANLIATTTYSLPATSGFGQNVALFSGLALGPGTYYLTLWNSCLFTCPDGGSWDIANPSPVILGTGVADNGGYAEHGINNAFPPATDYTLAGFMNFPEHFVYTVTGDLAAPAAVPEPASWLLLAIGAVCFAAAKRANQKRGSVR